MTRTAQVGIRFSVQDQEVVKRALRELGADGEKALKKLEDASKPAARNLLLVDETAKQARQTFEDFANRLGPVGSVLKAIGPAGLAAAAGLAAIALASKQSFQALADSSRAVGGLADVADKVGVTTEFLQELRFAAEENSVAQNTLDMALQRFSRRLGEAVKGQGELLSTLKENNIALVDQTGRARSTEEVFRDLADVIANTESSNERLRISFKAFDSEGAALVNLLNDGAAGLDQYARQANELGIVIEDKLVLQAKELADQVERLNKIRTVNFQREILGSAEVTGEALKSLEDDAARLGTFFGRIQNFWNQIVLGIAEIPEEILISPLMFFLDESDNLSAGVEGLTEDFLLFGDAALEMSVGVGEAGKASALTEGEIKKLREEYNQLLKSVDKSGQADRDRVANLDTVRQALAAGIITTEEARATELLVQEAYEGTISALERKVEKQKSVEEKTLDQIEVNTQLIAALKISQREYQIVDRTLKLLAQGFKGTEEEARKLATTLVEQEGVIKEMSKVAKEELDGPVTEVFENAARNIQDSFSDAIFNIVRNARLDFEDLGASLLDIFARVIAEMATLALAQPVILPIIQSVGGALGLGNAALQQVGAQFGLGSSVAAGGTAGAATSLAFTRSLLPNFTTSGLGQTLGLSAPVFDPVMGTVGGEVFLQNTAFGDAFNSLSSPAGLLGGFAGSALSNLIFTPRQGPGNEIGGTIGAIAGSFLPLPPGIGQAIGAFLGSAIGGLFGSKPSDRLEGTTARIDEFGNVVRTDADLGPKKDSPENRRVTDAIVDTVLGTIGILEDNTSGRVGVRNFIVETGTRSGIRIRGGEGDQAFDQSFQDGQQALAFLLDQVVGSLEGVPENIERAINNINFADGLQAAADRLDFALNFEAMIEALSNGSTDLAAAVQTMAAQDITNTVEQIRQFKRLTEDLFGADSAEMTQAADATREFVERLVGLSDNTERVTAAGQALDVLRGQFSAIGPLLEEVGLDAALAADLLIQAERALTDTFIEGLNRRLNESQGRGFLNQLSDLVVNIDNLNAEAEEFGEGFELVSDVFTSEASAIIDGVIRASSSFGEARISLNLIRSTFSTFPEIVSAVDDALNNLGDAFSDATRGITSFRQEIAEAMSERISSLEDERSSLIESVSALQRRQDILRRGRLDILLDTGLGILSPELQRSEALRQLEEAIATGADEGRLVELTNDFLNASKNYYASSEPFFQDVAFALNLLEKAEGEASKQVSVAEQQLSSLEEMVELQRAILDALNNGGTVTVDPNTGGIVVTAPPNAATDQEGYQLGQDYAARVQEYREAGFTEQDFLNSPEIEYWVGLRDDWTRRVVDRDLLLDRLSLAISQKSDPLYAELGASWERVILDRLDQISGFESGGLIQDIGRVHRGELLYTGPPAQVYNAEDSRRIMSGPSMAGVERNTESTVLALADGFDRMEAALLSLHDRVDTLVAKSEMLPRSERVF